MEAATAQVKRKLEKAPEDAVRVTTTMNGPVEDTDPGQVLHDEEGMQVMPQCRIHRSGSIDVSFEAVPASPTAASRPLPLGGSRSAERLMGTAPGLASLLGDHGVPRTPTSLPRSLAQVGRAISDSPLGAAEGKFGASSGAGSTAAAGLDMSREIRSIRNEFHAVLLEPEAAAGSGASNGASPRQLLGSPQQDLNGMVGSPSGRRPPNLRAMFLKALHALGQLLGVPRPVSLFIVDEGEDGYTGPGGGWPCCAELCPCLWLAFWPPSTRRVCMWC